jgi:hypothetical protein
MEDDMNDMMKPIRKYFKVEQAGKAHPKFWLIVCPKCEQMWHLGKDSKHPGNVLHLLNHARSHDETPICVRR